jgi:hypothetical protein
MLYRIKKIAFCSESHKKHINTLGGKNVEFSNAKFGGTLRINNEQTVTRINAFYFNVKKELLRPKNEGNTILRNVEFLSKFMVPKGGNLQL